MSSEIKSVFNESRKANRILRKLAQKYNLTPMDLLASLNDLTSNNQIDFKIICRKLDLKAAEAKSLAEKLQNIQETRIRVEQESLMPIEEFSESVNLFIQAEHNA